MQSEVGVGKDDCRELEGGKARENRRCRAEGEEGGERREGVRKATTGASDEDDVKS